MAPPVKNGEVCEQTLRTRKSRAKKEQALEDARRGCTEATTRADGLQNQLVMKTTAYDLLERQMAALQIQLRSTVEERDLLAIENNQLKAQSRTTSEISLESAYCSNDEELTALSDDQDRVLFPLLQDGVTGTQRADLAFGEEMPDFFMDAEANSQQDGGESSVFNVFVSEEDHHGFEKSHPIVHLKREALEEVMAIPPSRELQVNLKRPAAFEEEEFESKRPHVDAPTESFTDHDENRNHQNGAHCNIANPVFGPPITPLKPSAENVHYDVVVNLTPSGIIYPDDVIEHKGMFYKRCSRVLFMYPAEYSLVQVPKTQ